ncbi:protein-L-isoaspartate carboxylmethyltransferase [Amycolatopsis anabasis]|uniref:protein-L-isoaspartate carboxylmethyltransferase n=1 Tax=Amycolatopsis anabasis TaxID=1840409 RepID=UPI00131B4AC3|nr:protein-L-isoaspartate carboxylmethyltransferase [Amycolatopsis anabasis]
MSSDGDAADDDHAWARYAARMVGELAGRGHLHHPAWQTAFAEIPRHKLLPDADSIADPELEFASTAVATVAGPDGADIPCASPVQLAGLLEALRVEDDHRVLEVGTGTGYGAALLGHRLGDTAVCSIDRAAGLIATTRDRLASIGRHPRLDARDVLGGWPEQAPYDRILVTRAVSAVPWDWAEQLAEDGILAVSLAMAGEAGPLALLRRVSGRLEGRLARRLVRLPALAAGAQAALSPRRRAALHDEFVTRLPPEPWHTHPLVWFLAALQLPRPWHEDDTTMLSSPDGSWCSIALTPDDEGYRVVRQGGGVSIWSRVEAAFGWWHEWGQPSWDRFGLTVTPHGQYRVWRDSPDQVISRFVRFVP